MQAGLQLEVGLRDAERRRQVHAIIAARGAKVPELDNRHGRRATPALRMHPDAEEAVAQLHEKWAKY